MYRAFQHVLPLHCSVGLGRQLNPVCSGEGSMLAKVKLGIGRRNWITLGLNVEEWGCRRLAEAARAAREAGRDAQNRAEIDAGAPGLFAFINTRLGDAKSGAPQDAPRSDFLAAPRLCSPACMHANSSMHVDICS